MSHATESVKLAAKAVLDTLPDDASWEDVQYHLYVRQQIEAGLEDEAAGRLIDTDEMRKRLVDRKILRRCSRDERGRLCRLPFFDQKLKGPDTEVPTGDRQPLCN